MKYRELDNGRFEVEFDSEGEKEDFVRYFTESSAVSSKQVEQMGISRQLLKYHVGLGHVRTVPYGKQKRYLLEDVKTVKTKEGRSFRYAVRNSEFKKTECKRRLSSLPEDYDKYFFSRYSVDKDALEASLKTLRASNDQKLSRFIVKTLADAKKNARMTRELLITK